MSKEFVLLYQKWPLLVNAKVFDKAHLKMSRELRGATLISWIMENIGKFDGRNSISKIHKGKRVS